MDHNRASDAFAVALPLALARLGRVTRLAGVYAGYLDQLTNEAQRCAGCAGVTALLKLGWCWTNERCMQGTSRLLPSLAGSHSVSKVQHGTSVDALGVCLSP